MNTPFRAQNAVAQWNRSKSFYQKKEDNELSRVNNKRPKEKTIVKKAEYFEPKPFLANGIDCIVDEINKDKSQEDLLKEKEQQEKLDKYINSLPKDNTYIPLGGHIEPLECKELLSLDIDGNVANPDKEDNPHFPKIFAKGDPDEDVSADYGYLEDVDFCDDGDY